MERLSFFLREAARNQRGRLDLFPFLRWIFYEEAFFT
jgi:hypothetical protein